MLNSGESTSSGTSTPVQTSEKRCDNPDCHINKLITMVPKRKSTQFVSEPVVVAKPTLVNGFNAVFQVDGESAKLVDIKNPSGDNVSNKPIYRIVPNSHVHVVNYVVVDTDESYLKKINENDPLTMAKLVASQKESADQMLTKIMCGMGSTTTLTTGTNPTASRQIDNSPTAGMPINNRAKSTPVRPIMAIQPGPSPANIPAPSNESSKQSIQLPVRMHPNLKITAVTSAESLASLNPSPAPPNPPFVQPVPLASLQTPPPPTSMPMLPMVQNMAMANIPSPAMPTVVDKPTYDKMQEEINDLRRTVAMLAEAQAKNLLPPMPPTGTEQPGTSRQVVKRPAPRALAPK